MCVCVVGWGGGVCILGSPFVIFKFLLNLHSKQTNLFTFQIKASSPDLPKASFAHSWSSTHCLKDANYFVDAVDLTHFSQISKHCAHMYFFPESIIMIFKWKIHRSQGLRYGKVIGLNPKCFWDSHVALFSIKWNHDHPLLRCPCNNTFSLLFSIQSSNRSLQWLSDQKDIAPKIV